MKPFEIAYLVAEPFMLPLHSTVRRRLYRFARSRRDAALLDVGGRKSHYTIGIPARVTVTDVSRQSPVQHALNLGFTEDMTRQLRARRSNVESIMVDDMTRSSLPDASFDCVVAVEVLEHVEEDDAFVRHVSRVLRPGGVFLMTTPNGDSVPNANPDHRRHYTHLGLRTLLEEYFSRVTVEYAIASGRSRRLGLRPWSVHHPIRTAVGMAANVVNGIQSAHPALKHQARSTRHLIATAYR